MSRRLYAIHVDGLHALDLPVAALRDLSSWLVETSQRATRLRVEGRSTARGTPPGWLEHAVDLRITEFREGSLELAIAAPPLVEAVPEHFGQENMFFSLPEPDWTAFDLVVRTIEEVQRGHRDSEWLDPGVLEAVSAAGGMFARGVTAIRIASKRGEMQIDGGTIEGVERFLSETPMPKVDRVSGILDAVRVSGNAFTLKLADGRSLNGLFLNVSLDDVRPLLGKRVVVDGRVTFNPSGAPIRIDAEQVRAGTDRDALWSRTPRADVRVLGSAPLREALQTAGSLADVFGKWPGDETDEQLVAALARLDERSA